VYVVDGGGGWQCLMQTKQPLRWYDTNELGWWLHGSRATLVQVVDSKGLLGQ